MKAAVIFLFAALCAGCSTTLVRESPQSVRLGSVKLETAAIVEELLSRNETSVQALSGAWRDRTFQAQCVMKGDGETLTVIFLAPQMRLVTITVSKPHTIRYERAPRIPSAFEPEYALTDLAFVNLDAETLRRAVGVALSIDDDGVIRRICTPGGNVIAELVRQSDGTCRFSNLLHGYEYTLKKIQ